MKKITFAFFLVVLFTFSSCDNEVPYQRSDILALIDKIAGSEEVNIYMARKTIRANTEMGVSFELITSPDYDSWFVFIDDHPFANWSHPCRYVFIHPVTLKYEVVEMGFSPEIEDMVTIREVDYKKNGKLYDFSSFINNEARGIQDADFPRNKWAVIISGGVDRNQNHIRYWNDCSAIYSTLRHVYDYPKNQIYVLMSDGTDPAPDRRLLNGQFDSSPLDLDGDGFPDIEYAATKNNLRIVFNELAGRISSQDELLIFITDHGERTAGTSYINLWGRNELLSPAELSQFLSGIRAANINIVMEQCYSGGFINNLNTNNRVISTACSATELSYAHSSLLYNEFVYHWTAAVTGKDPYGNNVQADENGDGYVSMEEAFNYAKQKDIQPESPQYSSTPATLGRNINLGSSMAELVSYRIELYARLQWPEHYFPPSSQPYRVFVYLPQYYRFGDLYTVDERSGVIASGTVPFYKNQEYIEIFMGFDYIWVGAHYRGPELVSSIPWYSYENDPNYEKRLIYRLQPVDERINLSVGMYFISSDQL